jgi:16S rRNA (cytidine1402-2'-O)-methyltransferase
VTNTSSQSAGTLYVIATPIGNLGDLSQRAVATFAAATLVAAEDTRHSRRLLEHFGLDKHMVSLHEHNEDAQCARVLAALASGGDVALMSDAGTPLISDPGLKLVRAAIGAGVAVVSIPGPSAVTAALAVAGLPTDRFSFEGFLPRRREQRLARLKALAQDSRTLVLFESVHRVGATLADLASVLGATREAVVARELTKLNEQIARGSLAELAARLGNEIPLRGEFVLLVAGNSAERGTEDAEVIRIFGLLTPEIPAARAVALTAKICKRSRNEVYALTRA